VAAHLSPAELQRLPCVNNGDQARQWKRANVDPHRIDSAQSIAPKFVTGDYNGDP